VGRHELLDRLHDESDNLMKSVEDLDEEQMTKVWFGDWGVREILAHLAGWNWEMTAALERIARGEPPVPEGVSYDDADSWNERFAGGIQNTDPDEVIEDLRASKEAFIAAARLVPEDQFEEGKTAYRILHRTGIDHYREHYTAIQEWRQREGI
jgi:Protein of unknown function (DUF1706)